MRERYRPDPAGLERRPARRGHRRLETAVQLPLCRQCIGVFPESHRQPGQIGGTQCGRFVDLRPHHRHSQHIRLELHQQVVLRRAAIHPQFGDRDAGVGVHRLQHVRGLVGDGIERGTRDVRGSGAT